LPRGKRCKENFRLNSKKLIPAKHDRHLTAEALSIQGMSPINLYPKGIFKVLLVQHKNVLRNILAIMA